MSFVQQYEKMLGLMGDMREALPTIADAYATLYDTALGTEYQAEPRVLNPKTKELIALAIAIALRSETDMGVHTFDALRSGASRQEIMETIGVAILMGGSPAVLAGCQVCELMQQFEDELSASTQQPQPATEDEEAAILKTA